MGDRHSTGVSSVSYRHNFLFLITLSLNYCFSSSKLKAPEEFLRTFSIGQRHCLSAKFHSTTSPPISLNGF